MNVTLLHASDIHYGKRFDPGAMDGFLGLVETVRPDLLILSGDFTQRAKVREYQEARRFLDSLPPVPTVVTPGNHDVPLYRVWERAFLPHRNYREYIHRQLDYVTRVPGVTVVSLDSTAPRRAIVNGRISASQLRYAARAFGDAPEGDMKILVTHHNLTLAPDPESDKILPGHIRCLDAFSRMGVEFVLSVHLHRGFVSRPPGSGFGRKELPSMNSEEILIEPHLFQRDIGEFTPSGRQMLPRRGASDGGGDK
jgi:3',5'-cyclic AMP phosphodiesterase CpdA